LCGSVVWIEQIDGQRRKKGEFPFRREDPGGFGKFFYRSGRRSGAMREMASGEPSDATGRGEGDDASDSSAFGSDVEYGSKGALACMQRFDSTGIEVDRAFGEKETRGRVCQFGAGREGKGDIEHRLASGSYEYRRGDSHDEARTDRACLGQGQARSNTLDEGFM
jgi:hypothetical protein